MHYIIGTQLLFRKTQARPGMTSESVKNTKPHEFEYNKVYTLYNIKPNVGSEKTSYTYTFSSGRAHVQKQFDTLAEADSWLAQCRNESIPNYSDFYSRNTS